MAVSFLIILFFQFRRQEAALPKVRGRPQRLVPVYASRTVKVINARQVQKEDLCQRRKATSQDLLSPAVGPLVDQSAHDRGQGNDHQKLRDVKKELDDYLTGR